MRTYVDEETHRKVKLYATREGKGIRESYDRLIDMVLDSEGNLREPSDSPNTLIIELSPEERKILEEASKSTDMRIPEIIKSAILTIRVLFSTELTLADALKSVPDLMETLKEEG